MRSMLTLAAALVASAATPAAANNWRYQNAAPPEASYANYGAANYGYSGFGYGGYGYGYANLSQHGAAMPHWGDCPCCAGAWDGYCEERAARAAKRHCNTCGNTCGNGCGRVHRCRGAKACDTCGHNGGCGCASGDAAIESAPAAEQPIPPAPEATTPPPPAATSIDDRAARLPYVPGLSWLLSLSWAR
jgi:hypothetical protein